MLLLFGVVLPLVFLHWSQDKANGRVLQPRKNMTLGQETRWSASCFWAEGRDGGEEEGGQRCINHVGGMSEQCVFALRPDPQH